MTECAGEPDAGLLAVARLRASGRAYLEFAFTESGLFNAGHDRDIPPGEAPDYTDAFAFMLLAALLDELVTAGLMPADRRPMAEFGAWSAVHGLAVLVLDGPLNGLIGKEREAAVDVVLDSVVRSLVAPA